MRIFAIGDVVSSGGCEFVRSHLPHFKKLKQLDLVIANAENSAVGNGVTPHSANHLFDSGVDILTLGNHAYRRKEIYEYLDNPTHQIIRPANSHKSAPGKGICFIDMMAYQVAVINLLGCVYLDPAANPFDTADALIRQAKSEGCQIILLDFHAEATAEKKAMGYYLDGKISAVFGTHTHIQTADAQIMPNGTGYITDLGMTGPKHSVLGVTPELAIEKLRTGLPVRFENPDSPVSMQGCIFEIDQKTGLTTSVEAVELQ